MNKIITLLVVIAIGAGVWLAVSGLSKEVAKSSPTNAISKAKDAEVEQNILTLQMGIQTYASVNGGVPATATQTTIGSYVDPWPKNPYTLQPMQSGSSQGDYTYTPLGGTSFTIAGHLSSGEDVVRP